MAQTSDIKSVAANGLIDLGLAFMSSGDFDEAGNSFQQALDLARRDKSQAIEMRAHLSLGRLSFQKNDNDTAISELQTALNFYKPAGYRRETSLSLTLLGRAYQDKGEDDIALKLFEEQSQLVRQAGDESGVGDSHMNLAFLVGVNQEKYTEALSHLDEKLRIDESHHSERGQASDQMNRANFLWRLGRYDEARAALDAAFELANKKEAQLKTVLAWVHVIRARMEVSQGQYAEAKKEAQLALDASDKFPDAALQAGQGVRQHHAGLGALDLQLLEGGLAGREAAAEVDDHVGLRVIEDVEREARADGEPVADLAFPVDRHANQRRLEGAVDPRIPSQRHRWRVANRRGYIRE